jgi:hypothetical protein
VLLSCLGGDFVRTVFYSNVGSQNWHAATEISYWTGRGHHHEDCLAGKMLDNPKKEGRLTCAPAAVVLLHVGCRNT